MDLHALLAAFFDPQIARAALPEIWRGMQVTAGVGLAVIVTGLAAGLLLAVIRALQWRPVTWAIVGFADILRALPPLVVIIVLFFAFPYLGLEMTAFEATWLSLSLVLAAFAEEIFWAGILSVPVGQAEAARSTGMGWWQTMGFVVLPQAFRLSIAPLTNRAISITKNMALGSVVALPEILNNAQSASSNAGNATPLALGALAYLAIFIPVVMLGRWIETRFHWKR